MKKNIILFFFIIFIFSGLIKWLPLGGDPTVYSLIVLMVLGVPYFKFTLLLKNLYSILFLLSLLLIAVASVSYTDASVAVWQKKLIGLMLGVFAFLYPVLAPSVFNDPSRFLRVIRVIFYVVLALLLLEYLIFGVTRIIDDPPEKFPDYLSLGAFIGLGITASISSPSKYIKTGVIILGILILLSLGGRGPVLFLGIIFILRYIYVFKKVRGLTYLIYILLLPLIFLMGFYSKPIILESIIPRFSTLSFDGDVLRIQQYLHSLQMIFEHPIIGSGIGGFGNSFYGYDIYAYPHNIFLEITAELGVPSLILLLLFGLASIRKVFSTSLSSDQHIIWLIFIFFLLNGMKSGGIDLLRLITPWLGLIIVMTSVKLLTAFKFNNTSTKSEPFIKTTKIRVATEADWRHIEQQDKDGKQRNSSN